MKILYLAHRLPYPPNKGDKIRSFHELAFLARRHRVWCACFVDDVADRAHVAELGEHCEALAAIPLNRRWATGRGLGRLVRGGTVTEGFYDDRRMWRVLQHWSADVAFDAVVVFSSGMAPYGLSVPAGRRAIDFCDWDSLKWAAYARDHRGLRRRLYGLEADRLRQREREWVEAYDESIVITRAEAEALHDPGIEAKVRVVGNGVAQRPYVVPPNEPRVGFVGAMDYAPNVAAVCGFVERVWPAVRRAVPEATFRIIGRRPAKQVRALARRPGVEVVGEVADVGRQVDACPVHAVLLDVARGLQNKVLEAMAAGRAVVASTAAVSGIGGRDGRDYLVADDPERAVEAVVDLLRHPRRARGLGASARALVAERFDWDRELGRLEGLLVPAPEPAQTKTAEPEPRGLLAVTS